MVMLDSPDTHLLPPDCQIILITTQPHPPTPSPDDAFCRQERGVGGEVRTFARFWNQYNVEMSRKYHNFVATLSQFWDEEIKNLPQV